MVVLAIVGLLAAAVVIAIPDPRGKLADEATGLGARLAAARDMAIVGGHDIAVRVDQQGYGFAERYSGGWQAATAAALQPRQWQADTSAIINVEGGNALIFDTTGLATPAQVTLQRDGLHAGVTVDAAGAVRVAAR